MKQLLFTVLLLYITSLNAQDYFKGKNLYCPSESAEAVRLFKIGIETLYLNTLLDKKYLAKTAEVFLRAYKADTTFCDAAFFTGYTLRLLNDKNAFVFYYVADSLAQKKPALEFKVNLAAECLRIGTPKTLEIARKKYVELIKAFPDSPEGYYGFAVTSPIFKDEEKGLENVNIAIEKYNQNGLNPDNNAIFLKATLLTINKRYEESLYWFEQCRSTFKKDINFNTYYALSLLKVSQQNNDEKMKKQAKKFYDKIDAKDAIDPELKKEFIF